MPYIFKSGNLSFVFCFSLIFFNVSAHKLPTFASLLHFCHFGQLEVIKSHLFLVHFLFIFVHLLFICFPPNHSKNNSHIFKSGNLSFISRLKSLLADISTEIMDFLLGSKCHLHMKTSKEGFLCMRPPKLTGECQTSTAITEIPDNIELSSLFN